VRDRLLRKTKPQALRECGAAGTPGSAVVSLNAENEISFSISDAHGRSLMSGIVATCDKSSHHSPRDELRFKRAVTSGIGTHDHHIDFVARVSTEGTGLIIGS